MFNLVYKLYNASAILIEWPQQIDTAILHDILAVYILCFLSGFYLGFYIWEV